MLTLSASLYSCMLYVPPKSLYIYTYIHICTYVCVYALYMYTNICTYIYVTVNCFWLSICFKMCSQRVCILLRIISTEHQVYYYYICSICISIQIFVYCMHSIIYNDCFQCLLNDFMILYICIIHIFFFCIFFFKASHFALGKLR